MSGPPESEGERPRRGRPPKLSMAVAREKILDAAVVAFAERGVRGVSLDDIGAEAGMTKPAIYKAFDSKEEIFVAAIEREVGRMEEAAIESWVGSGDLGLAERTRKRIARYFEEAERRPYAMRLMLGATRTGVPGVEEALEASRGRMIANLAQLVRDDLAQLGGTGGPSVDILAAGLVDMTVSTALRSFERDNLPAEAVIDLLAAFYTAGFAAAAAGPMQKADELIREAGGYGPNSTCEDP